MSDVPVRQFGVIKWFGGFNNKTGRENSFGFVAATDGTEFYLHRKDWCDAAPPIALQPVAFSAEVRSDRVCCRRASPLRASDCSLAEIHAALTALPSAPDASAGLMDAMAGLRAALHEELHSRLQTSSSRDLQDLCAANTAARSPFGVISRSSHAVTDYALMLDATGAAITSSDVWDYLPRQLIGKYEADIATQLVALTPDVLRSRVDALIEELPAPLIITLLARRSLADDAVSGALRVRLDRYLCAVILDGEAIPAYVIALAGDPRDWRWLCGSAMLQGLLDRCHFKKSLAARGTEFLEIYARAPGLARDLEYVILHELFSLVAAGNVREVVYNVFLQRLWQALIDQQVDLYAQQHALQSLFPSCEIMGPTLSCEAFFWRENESQEPMFLCRGKRCRHPQILPHAHRAVADYTLYDWLARWDITYENAGRPRSRDFPIRIAGYLNRLREIYNRLHCRACATLMVPHMDYARTSYKSLSDGVVRVEQLAAAYRLTVFHCNDAACAEHGKNYYINHCLGFNCREIIDSRDLKNKCAAGRYVCNVCGSCCQEHGSQSRQASDTRSLSHGVTGRPHAAATARPSEALSGVRTAGVDNTGNTGYEPVRQARAALTLDEILNVAWPEARDR